MRSPRATPPTTLRGYDAVGKILDLDQAQRSLYAVLAMPKLHRRVYVISIVLAFPLLPSNISRTCFSGLITRKTVFIGMSFRPLAGQLALPSSVMTLLLLSPFPSLVNIEVCVSLTQTLLNVCFVLSKPNRVRPVNGLPIIWPWNSSSKKRPLNVILAFAVPWVTSGDPAGSIQHFTSAFQSPARAWSALCAAPGSPPASTFFIISSWLASGCEEPNLFPA